MLDNVRLRREGSRMEVILIAAMSLDGCLTRHDEAGTGFVSAADGAWFRETLGTFGASIMGRRTYEAGREKIRASQREGHLRLVLTRDTRRFADEAEQGVLEFGAFTPEEALAHAAACGCKRVALLGGTAVHDAFLAAGLIDEVWLTLEPRLFGEGVRLLGARCDVALRLRDVAKLDADVLLVRYAVKAAQASTSSRS